jgi:hypothetical protein
MNVGGDVLANFGPFSIAVDFDGEGEIKGGWIAFESGQIFNAYISTPKNQEVKLLLTVPRPDVVTAGHSKNVMCGFYLPEGHVHQPGDFIRIRIETEDGVNLTHSWLMGRKDEAFTVFDEISFPRDNFEICEIPTQSLMETKTSTELLKCLIIRLRRGKRGLSGRGDFVPYEYAFAASDFKLLQLLLTEYSFAIQELLGNSMRWLFSINDTLSDWSQGLEKSVSLYVGSFMLWERSAQTVLKSKGASFDLNATKNMPGQFVGWGKMGTHQLSSDDALDIYLARTWDFIRESRFWLHFELLRRMFVDPESLHGLILAASDDATASWTLYEQRCLTARDERMWHCAVPTD